MTWYSAKDVAYVFIGGTSVGGFLNSLRLKVNAQLCDTRTLGNVFPTMSDTGLRNGELELSGFYDDTAAGQVMNTVSGTDRVVSVLLEGNTVSKRFYGFQAATVSATEIGISAENVHTSTPGMTPRSEVNHGYVVAPYAARTTGANTDSTYADLGADAATAHCYLHVGAINVGGGSGCTVTLRDSNDHVTFANAQAFAIATAVGGWVVNTTTLEQYLSAAWAWTGGTNPSISFFVGVAVD